MCVPFVAAGFCFADSVKCVTQIELFFLFSVMAAFSQRVEVKGHPQHYRLQKKKLQKMASTEELTATLEEKKKFALT